MFHEVPTAPGALRRTASMHHPQVTHSQDFCFMGEALRFESNDLHLLAAAEAAYSRFVVAQPANAHAPLLVQLFVRQPGKDPPRPDDSSRPSPYPRLICHTMGHLFYLNVGAENTLVVDLLHGVAFGMVTPQLARDQDFVRYTFLEAAAQAMLGLSRHFVAVHAACVVKHGVSVMLQANAGVGKSTLAFACLRRGWQVLAEDVVQVKIAPDSLRLWGIPWKFHLLADSLRFFPELGNQRPAMQVNGEWKIALEIEAHLPGAALTSAGPGLMVWLTRAAASTPTHCEAVPMDEARQLFEVAWGWQSGWRAEYDERLGELLHQGTYLLHMNGSPDEAVDALEGLIEEYRT